MIGGEESGSVTPSGQESGGDDYGVKMREEGVKKGTAEQEQVAGGSEWKEIGKAEKRFHLNRVQGIARGDAQTHPVVCFEPDRI
jgi:hypothetical protein